MFVQYHHDDNNKQCISIVFVQYHHDDNNKQCGHPRHLMVFLILTF